MVVVSSIFFTPSPPGAVGPCPRSRPSSVLSSFARTIFAALAVLGMAVLGMALTPSIARSEPPAKAKVAGALSEFGAAMVPADAAFFSATLRGREQIERLVGSRAWASIMQLPAVRRARESIEDQRTTPGSPLSLADTFMQLPENRQALDLLADMVATDTFVYGGPACIGFLRLATRVQQATRAAAIAGPAEGVFEFEMEEEMLEDDDEEDNDARLGPASTIVPVALRQPGLAVDEAIDAGAFQARVVLKAFSDNLDLIAVPDVVWGFKTTMPEAARTQLRRVEVLGQLAAQANPDLVGAVGRRAVPGGEVVTFALDASQLPAVEIARELLGDLADTPEADAVLTRLEKLRMVVAVGVIGDRVILSIGDSVDHLGRLVLSDDRAGSLLASEPFAPLRAQADQRITGISYLSADLAREMAPNATDVEPIAADALEAAVARADLSEEAAADARAWVTEAAAGYARRLPVPGPWMAFSFLSDQGYSGEVWDWAQNQPYDATKRLHLLEYAGGAPLGVVVSRFKSDPRLIDDVVRLVEGGWSFVQQHGLPGDSDTAVMEAAAEQLGPLATKVAAIVRDKLVPAVDDSQVGLVIDAKSRSKRLHRDLPSSSEPLPTPEASIVLPLADPALFRQGLSDLFELSDAVIAAVRAADPDALPTGYRIPDPEKTKVEGGTIWSFPLTRTGIDEQVRPTIGVGDKAAVFSLAPKQAIRMLSATRLETGSSLSSFDEPLASAASLDVAGLLDVVRPWLVYLARYGSVQQRDGFVDADRELSAEDEGDQAKEALAHATVVLEAAKSLRVATAETTLVDGALVTRWRNVIRDLPAK